MANLPCGIPKNPVTPISWHWAFECAKADVQEPLRDVVECSSQLLHMNGERDPPPCPYEVTMAAELGWTRAQFLLPGS